MHPLTNSWGRAELITKSYRSLQKKKKKQEYIFSFQQRKYRLLIWTVDKNGMKILELFRLAVWIGQKILPQGTETHLTQKEKFIGSYNPTKINSSLGKEKTCTSTLETHEASIFSLSGPSASVYSWYILSLQTLFFYNVGTVTTSVFMSLIQKAVTTWKGLTFSLLI